MSIKSGIGALSVELPRQGMPTQYAYDENGNVVRTQNGDRVTTYEYDALGNRIAVIAPDGSKIQFAYDAAGNMLSATDANGNVTKYEYDAMGWAEKLIYADGTSCVNQYDLAGNVVEKTDASGAKTAYEYDALGNVTQTTDALGNIVKYEYDALSNLKKVTDALGNVTTYEYDSQGNMLSETDALGNEKQYTYTKEGWLEKITNPDGTVTAFTYDALGQMTSEDYNGEKKVTHTYNEMGLLTRLEGAGGNTAYQYDDKGQLVSVTNPAGDVVKYSYDDYGRKTGMVYPDGKSVAYAYDEMNRLVEVSGLDGHKTAYEYDAAGNRVKTQSDTLTTEYRYDEMNRVAEQSTTGKTEISFAYEYDANGYLTGEKRTEGETAYNRSYTYDALGQLEAFAENDHAEQYTYDAAGNMTQKSVNGVKTEMMYNAVNQMTELASQNGTVRYEYDQNGNMVKKTLDNKTNTYSYDATGRLEAYLDYDGYEERYSYDAAGNRVEKRSRGTSNRLTLEELAALGEQIETQNAENPDEWVTTEYINDGNATDARVLMERTNGKRTYYDYGLERLSQYVKEGLGERKTDYVYDGRGSVAQEISYNNSWYNYWFPFTQDERVESKRYTPFGESLTQKVSGYGYNAEDYSAQTGQQYLRMRYYDPSMMRFSQKDMVRGSIENPISLNRYIYTNNNPVNYADPSGMRRSGFGGYGIRPPVIVDIIPVIFKDPETKKNIAINLLKKLVIDDIYNEAVQTAPKGTTVTRDKDGYPVINTGGKSYTLRSMTQVKSVMSCLQENEDIYDSFWGRTDGYFDGQWWHDDAKRNAAFEMLLLEAQNSGSFDPFIMGTDPNKVKAIQALANSPVTGSQDVPLVVDLTSILRLKGINYEGGELGEKEINALRQYEAAIVWRESGYVLEGGWGQVISGTMIIGGGIAANYIAGKAPVQTVDDVLYDAAKGRTTKGRTTQYEKVGGYDKALSDFESMGVKNVRIDSNGTTIGTLPDGRTINVRNQSSFNAPTLEIQNPNGTSIKIRYTD